MRKVRKVLYVLICVIMVGCMINVSNIQASTSSKISPPKVVLVKTTGTSEIRIKWKKVNGVSGYRIYRKNDNSGWKAIKTVKGENVTAYTDNGLNPGKQYFYTVKAYKKVSNSNVWSKAGKELFAVTKMEMPQINDIDYGHRTGTVDISWSKSNGAQYYEILFKTQNNKWKVVEKSNRLNAKQVSSTIGKNTYAVRACVKYSGKVYRSGYDKKGTVFQYDEYGNPNVDYSVFDIINPETTQIEMKKGEYYEVKIDSDLDKLSCSDNNSNITDSYFKDATDSDYLLKIHAIGTGTATIHLYGTDYPNVYKNITVVVKEDNNAQLVMAAIGIQKAYNSAKFPSSLHIKNIAYEESLTNGYGDNISRLVVHAYAKNSFGGYGDIYSVVIRSKTNTHYSNAFEYNGYYYTTSAFSHNPGMNGVWVNNKAAVNMWKYLYEKNFEIPYD